MARGLICYPAGGTADGRRGDHILLAPPFIVTPSEVAEICDRLARRGGRGDRRRSPLTRSARGASRGRSGPLSSPCPRCIARATRDKSTSDRNSWRRPVAPRRLERAGERKLDGSSPPFCWLEQENRRDEKVECAGPGRGPGPGGDRGLVADRRQRSGTAVHRHWDRRPHGRLFRHRQRHMPADPQGSGRGPENRTQARDPMLRAIHRRLDLQHRLRSPWASWTSASFSPIGNTMRSRETLPTSVEAVSRIAFRVLGPSGAVSSDCREGFEISSPSRT